MPILTISQLTKVVTRDEALTSLLTMLQGFGFNTTSWQTGSIQRSLVEIGAEIWSQASGTVATITNNGFNQLATKEGLTQFSDSVYDNQREEATPTQGTMRLTETGGGGPYVQTACGNRGTRQALRDTKGCGRGGRQNHEGQEATSP